MLKLKEIIKSLKQYFLKLFGVYKFIEIINGNIVNSITNQSNYINKGTQILMSLKYQEIAENNIILKFDDIEFRNNSQNGEDGILWYIFSLIGTKNKKCVEICAGDGITCNSANLIINHGWSGLLFDGDDKLIIAGKNFYNENQNTQTFPPKIINAWINTENINRLLTSEGYKDEIDLLSLDIDGVDYWIWKAINVIQPRVVVAEIQAIWGDDRSVTVPYDPNFKAQFFNGFGIYSGASLPAFVKLAKSKGYRLVGCEKYGFNAFFIRNDIGQEYFPEVPASSCFKHPFAKWAYDELRPKITEYEWQEV